MMNHLYPRGGWQPKRWLTLLSMVWLLPMMLGSTASAQYLSENFNTAWTNNGAGNGAPPSWTQAFVLNTPGHTVAPVNTFATQAWFQLIRNGGAWTNAPSSYGLPTRLPNNSALVDGDNVAFLNDGAFTTGSRIGAVGARLISPSVNLSASTDPYFSFDFWYNGQTGHTPVSRIEISTDNGTTWQLLTFCISPQGTGYQWVRQAAAIPAAYRLSSVRFAITHFGTFGSNNVAIDNVLVAERSASNPLYFRTTGGANTSANALATWESATSEFGAYTAATRLPSALDYVYVQSGHTLNIDAPTGGAAPFPQAVTWYGDLTVEGTVNFATSGTPYLAVTNNINVLSGGVLFNNTTSTRVYLGGNLVNNGSVSLSTATTSQLILHGVSASSISGSGTFAGPNLASVVIINKPGGLTFSQTANLQIRNEFWGMAGTVTHSNNVTLGVTGTTLSINKGGNFDFGSDPVYGLTTAGTVNYILTEGSATTALWGSPSRNSISPGREVPLVSGVRTVRSAFTVNHHGTVTLNYPLQLGTSTTGSATFTRGIINTSLTNPLILSANFSSITGTSPTLSTTNVRNTSATHGSYVNGPIRIQFPATGTTSRTLPLGFGSNVWDSLNNRSGNAFRPVVISTTTAWASQDLTIEPITNVTSTTTGLATVSSRGFRVYRNTGDLAATAAINLNVVNQAYSQGGESLPAGLTTGNLRSVQATSASGPWTVRGIGTGTLAFSENTSRTLTSATASPGPIAPLATNGDFFTLMVNGATVGTVAATTPVTTAVSAGNADVQVLRINIPQNAGGGTITLNSLGITGTFTAGDVTNAKVFAGSSTAPSGGALATINSPTTAMNFTGINTALVNGDNYFWITYSIAATVNGSGIQASLNAGGVGVSAAGGADASGTLPAAIINGSTRAFAPPVTVTPASPTICSNGTGTTLTASSSNAGYTYTWSPATGLSATTGASVTANPATTTTYTVTGTDGPLVVARNVTVTVTQVPTLSVIPAASLVCQNSPVGLTLGTAGNVKVGTGTTTVGGSITGQSPFAGWWGGVRQQYIYRASEIAASGSATVTALGFVIAGLNSSPAIYNGYTIKMANVSENAFATTSFLTPTFTTVYGPVNEPVPAANAIKTFTLTTPFVWDGTSNILVEICFNNNNEGPGSGTVQNEVTVTSFNSALSQGNDNNSGVCTAATGTQQTTRPNIIFTGLISPATPAMGLTNVTWSPGAEMASSSGLSNTFTPTTSGSRTVTVTFDLGTCSGSATANIDVTAAPSAPVIASNPSHCGSQVPGATFTHSGNTLRFYTAASGGTPIEAVASPGNKLVDYLVAATTTLYVESFNGTCASPRTPFTVNVVSSPGVTITPSATNVCPGEQVTLTASSSASYTYTWSTPSNPNFATGASIQVNPAENTVYTAVGLETATGCTNQNDVTITTKPAPPTPVISRSAAAACVGSPVILTALAEGNSQPSGTGTVAMGTSTAINSSLFPGWYWSYRNQYLFTASELEAMGLRSGSTINSLSVPVTTAGGPAAYTQYILRAANISGSVTALTALQTPSFTLVYSNPTQARPAANTTATITFTTPFVWNGGSLLLELTCRSATAPANTVTPGTNTTENRAFSAYGGSAYDFETSTDAPSGSGALALRPNFTFTGTVLPSGLTVTWAPNPNLSATTGATVTLTTVAGANNVTATFTNAGGCSTSGNGTVTGTANPTAPTVSNNISHCGNQAPKAQFTAAGADTVLVYTQASGGTPVEKVVLANGNTMSTYLVNTTGTNLWVSAKFAGTGCEGPRTQFTVTVTPAPNVTVVSNKTDNNVCIGDAIQLTASGTGYTSYTWSRLGAPNFTTGAVISVSPSETTTYTVVATAPDGCSNTGTITVNVFPIPDPVATASVSTACAGTPVTLTAGTQGASQPSGSGTVVQGTSTTINSSVFPGWLWSYRTQYLFTPTELQAMGLSAGSVISGFSVPTGSATGPATYSQYIVRAANISGSTTSLTSFVTPRPSFTTVYTNASQARPSANATATITFTTPFVWDGGSLVVEITSRNANAPANTQTSATTTPETRVFVAAAGSTYDFETAVTAPTSTGTTPDRPNFTFQGIFANPALTVTWSPATNLSSATGATVTLFPVAGANNITATVTNAGGCSNTANVQVTGVALPATPTAATNTSHCGVNVPNITINTSGQDSMFVWNAATDGTLLQRTNVTAATTAFAGFTMGSGSVWVSTKNSTGCVSPRGEIVVTSTAAPALSAAIQGAYEICANSGSPVTLVATGPAYTTFTWSRPGAANFATGASIVVDPAGTTTYTVVATDGSCTNEATVTVNRIVAFTLTASTTTPQVLTGANVTLNSTFQQTRTTQQVGGGSVANAANSTVAGTMYSGWFGNAKHRYLFRAAELSAAGYSAGVIRQLITSIGTVGGPNTFNGYTVRMANTSITDLTTGSMANLGTSFSFTTVFGPVNRTISPNQEDVLTFTNNFVWDGTSNVLLEYCFSNGNSGTGTPIQPIVTTSFTSGAYAIADGDQGDYCEVTTSGTRVSNRPNIRFTQAPGTVNYSWTGPGGFTSTLANPNFAAQLSNSGQFIVTATVTPSNCQYKDTVDLSVVPCPIVTDVVATGTGSSTATVTWTAPFGAASYRVEAVPASLAIGAPVAITTTGTTANFSGLLAGTPYTFRVQTVCVSGARSQIVTANATTFLSNDEPCGARPLTVGYNVAPLTQDQGLASTSGGAPEPTCKGAFQTVSRDLWYSVTAPSTGILAIYVTRGTSDQNLIDVFSGADCGSISGSLGCTAGAVSSNSFLYVSGLTPGAPILIRVSASGAVGGTFSIAVAPGLLWTAATNNLWATAGNWYNNQIPTSTQQAVIPAKGTQPVVGSSTSVGSVNMEAGASLTLNATLTLSGGTSTFNGNTVTTAPGVALAMSGTNTIAGNLTVDTMAVSGTTNIANGASLTINRALRINASGTFNNTGTGSVLLNSGNGFTANLAPVGSGGSYNGNLTQRVWFPQPTTFAGRWYFFGMGVKNATLSNFATQWYTRGFANAWDPSGNSNVFFGNESATSGWSSATDASNALTPGRGVRVFPGAQIRNRSAWTVTGPPVVGNGVDQTNTGGTEAFSFGTLAKTAGTETVSGFHFLSNPYPAAINWTTTNWTRTNIEPTIHVWDAIAATYKTYNHITGVGTRGTAAQGGGILASGQGFMVQVGGTAPTTGSLSVTEAAKVGTTWNAYRQAVLPVRVKLEAAARPENHDEMLLGMLENMTTGLDAETDARKLLGGALDVYMELNGEKTTVNFMSKPSSTLRIPVNFRSVATGAHSLSFSDVANLLQDNLSVTLVDNYLGTSTLLTGDVRYEFTVDASISATTADGRFELVVAPARVTNLAGNVNRAVFGVYPNPASSNSELSLVLNNYELTGKAAVVITDALGRVVMSERLNGSGAFNTWKLETGLAAGMYTVKVMAGSESFSQKLVVK